MGSLRNRIAARGKASDFEQERDRAAAGMAKSKAPYFAMLAVSIACEVVGTICMKLSLGFTLPGPTLVTAVTYAVTMSLLVVILKHLPLGLVYGIWGGVGTAATMLVGVVVWNDPFTGVTALALVLIVVGVYLLNKGTDEIEAKKLQQDQPRA